MKEWLVTNIVKWLQLPFGVKLAVIFLTLVWLLVLVVDPVNWIIMTSICTVCWAVMRIMTYLVEGK